MLWDTEVNYYLFLNACCYNGFVNLAQIIDALFQILWLWTLGLWNFISKESYISSLALKLIYLIYSIQTLCKINNKFCQKNISYSNFSFPGSFFLSLENNASKIYDATLQIFIKKGCSKATFQEMMFPSSGYTNDFGYLYVRGGVVYVAQWCEKDLLKLNLTIFVFDMINVIHMSMEEAKKKNSTLKHFLRTASQMELKNLNDMNFA